MYFPVLAAAASEGSILGGNIFQVVFFGIFYVIGGFLCYWIRMGFRGFCDCLPRKWNPYIVSLTLNGCLVIAALALCIINRVGLGDILNSLLPLDSFRDVAGSFSGGQDRYLFNVVVEAVGHQMDNTLNGFIFYILFELTVQILCSLLCCEDDSPWGGVLQYGIDLLALMAINGIVLSSGTSVIDLVTDVVSGYFDQEGHTEGWYFVFILAVMFISTYLIIHQTMSNDLVVSFIGVNVFALISGADVSSRYLWVFLTVALVCSYGFGKLRPLAEQEEVGVLQMLGKEIVFCFVELIFTMLFSRIVFGLIT